MKKKLLIGLSIPIVLILAFLILVPLFLEAKIGSLLRQNINNQIEGQFDFKKASLSLISSFPNAELSLDNAHLTTNAPFEGDTLFYAQSLELEMGIFELFKSAEETLTINSIVLDKGSLNLREDQEARVNYDILKEEAGTEGANNSSEGFSFSLSSYEIRDADIRYASLDSGIDLMLHIMEHRGSGDLALKDSKLDTQTEGSISLALDSLYYLQDIPFTWQALIGMDLEQYHYRFLDNRAKLQQLALVFGGEVKIEEDYQEYDIRFEAPAAQFQDFLSVLPERITGNLSTITAEGDLEASGTIKGKYSDNEVPEFGIGIKTENARVQYAQMPRSIDDISFEAALGNDEGNGNNINLEVKDASFHIGEDTFLLNARIKDVLEERTTVMSLKTNMNLAHLGEAYPLPNGIGLSGRLAADISAAFNERVLKQKAYEQIQLDGTADLQNFVYTGPAFAAPLRLAVLKGKFSRDRMLIQAARGSTGKSDFEFTGTLFPVLGYQLGGQDLQGKVNLRSNTFVVADFVPSATTAEKQSEQDSVSRIKIPENLNIEVQARAGKVVYNDLELEDFQGKISVKEGAVNFQEVTTGFFDGKLALQGSVTTLKEQPQFALALVMEQLQIQKAFETMGLFQALVPVAKAMEGRFSSQLALSGDLSGDFRPDISSLTGDVLAEVLAANVKAEQLPVLNNLNTSFNFIDFNKLNLKGLKTALAFERGKVRVKPFGFTYDDIAIRVEGGHGFDRSLDYQLKLDVPAKYLGPEVQRLVASIGENELKDLKLPVQVGITGSHTSPQIKSDLSSGVKGLTNQLVELQKQKMLNKGKDKAGELLSGVIGKSTDTTKSKKGEVVKGVLDVLKKTPKDSTGQDSLKKTGNPLEEQAKGLLKGLLNKKKKDTVN